MTNTNFSADPDPDPDPAMDENLAARCPLATVHIMDPMDWYYRNYPPFSNDDLHPEDDIDIIFAQYELVQIRLKRENARRDWEVFVSPSIALPSITGMG